MLITIIKAPDSVSNAGSSKSFGNEGGTIGRGEDNTWVLEDPECYLSSCHCQIAYENGRFNIIDRSTNGTFYNGSRDPMGKGTKLPVNDKDTFIVGDYEFSITLESEIPQFDMSSGGPFDSAPPDFQETPFAGAHIPNSDLPYSAHPAETDPLAALDKAQGSGNQLGPAGGVENTADPWAGPTHSDQANPLNQQVSWPEPLQGTVSGGAIPDDWDEDISSPSAGDGPQSAYIPPTQPSTPLTEPPVVPRPGQPSQQIDAAEQPVAVQNEFSDSTAENPPQSKPVNQTPQLDGELAPPVPDANAGTAIDKTLIGILGFQDKNLTDAQIAQINRLSGEVLREMVSGLMQVLGSRSAIKNEFRMNVTTIQPVENNPLKFSANVDDALENMFIKQGNAYKKPIEAVQDGFEGIAEHQVAILAGIREAFKGVIERFDPVLLEQRFSKLKKGGLIPGSQKAKFWESYQDYYNELVGDMDRSFQYLYGDEFVRAYENQLQKLALSRKDDKQN
jgi:type VI secretion system FHA domain protein